MNEPNDEKDISKFLDSIKVEGVTFGPLLKKDPSMSENEWEEKLKAHREKFLSGLGFKLTEENNG